MNAKPRQVVKFSHYMLSRKVVGAIVVGKNPYIAELAKERTATRYFQHGTVITLISCVQKGPVKASRLGDIEPYFRLEDCGQQLSCGGTVSENWKRFLAVTDKNVIEHGELATSPAWFSDHATGPPTMNDSPGMTLLAVLCCVPTRVS